MEDLLEFLEAANNWASVPLGLALLLLVTAGSGLWRSRWKKALWGAGLLLLAATFYFGVARHEWGEVLFNGQLL
ncbi:MAG: hypothetical protein AB1578_05265 [Thermodesulfobacteriota bacterium]